MTVTRNEQDVSAQTWGWLPVLALALFAAPLGAQAIQFEDVKLLASDGEAGDHLGFALAVSGNTLVVGAFSADPMGAAYVFERQGARWTEQTSLVPLNPGPTGGSFGTSVALDGDTAVIGDSSDDSLGSNAGAAYVFVRDGSRWSQQAKLLPDIGFGGRFGLGVAIDGETIVVGAPFGGPEVGAGEAYVFVRSGSTWSRQAYLVAGDAIKLQCFGESVSISGDTLGIQAAPQFGQGLGATYLFERDGADWVEQEQQFPAGFPKLSGDTFAVGNQIYVRNGDSWDLQANVMPSIGPGGAVALEGDLCVMSSCTFESALFTRSGSVWTEQVVFQASDGQPGDFFACVGGSLSGDTVVLGASGHDALGRSSGAAYVYTIDVPECFLVIGQQPGSSIFGGASHLFDTQVGPVVEDSHAVLMEDIPEFVLPPVLGGGPSLTWQGAARGAGPGTQLTPPASSTPAWLLDGQATVQVLLWNPTVFPQLPEQSSAALVVEVLPDGSVQSELVGTSVGDLRIWAEVTQNAHGQRVLRFPFQVGGL